MNGATIARARPAARNVARLPQGAFAAAAPFAAAARPLELSGYRGPARVPRATRAEPPPSPQGPTALPSIAPQGFGAGQLSSIYHYTDYLVDPEFDDDAPWRWAGRFTFVAETGEAMFCPAA